MLEARASERGVMARARERGREGASEGATGERESARASDEQTSEAAEAGPSGAAWAQTAWHPRTQPRHAQPGATMAGWLAGCRRR
jgi:hypothetical protein